MLLHQFNCLSNSWKYKYVLLKGVCISDRTTDKEDILLFQVEGHYIEVVFQRNTDHIINVVTFTETDELQPYLAEININGLFA